MDRDRIQDEQHRKMGDKLQRCGEILLKKEKDYGRDNFIKASFVASLITGKELSASDVAACLIGIKTARYAQLTVNKKIPENEPLDDSIVDWINYILLMERERRTDEVFNRKQADENEETP